MAPSRHNIWRALRISYVEVVGVGLEHAPSANHSHGREVLAELTALFFDPF